MNNRKLKSFFLLLALASLTQACSQVRLLTQSAEKELLQSGPLAYAHVGISVYEPATQSYWYNYQADKYFVPASNVKIATCYAAMKYLGDSLAAARYRQTDSALILYPTGDPTFLHPDFTDQKLLSFLKNNQKPVNLSLQHWQANWWGKGWAWDDYNDDYMAERSAFPMYGNVVRISGPANRLSVYPRNFFALVAAGNPAPGNWSSSTIRRSFGENRFYVQENGTGSKVEVPFITTDSRLLLQLLADTLKVPVAENLIPIHETDSTGVMFSRPTDSLLQPMMHRSDNFFAEQALLMVSNEILGEMDDQRIIDTLLNTIYKDLPQQPRWVDGSGLSRYNMFTPQDFVFILNKMEQEFGMDRLKTIFPTAGEGTLRSFGSANRGFLFAKTGSLSGVYSLSGYLYTRKNKLLIFSVMINHYQAKTAEVRQAVERFLQVVRHNY